MKKGLVLLCVAMLVLISWDSVCFSENPEADKVAAAVAVLNEIQAIPEGSIPPALLQNAHGIAVIPNLLKAGFVVGGRYGWGVLSVRLEGGGWSPPCFVSLIGGSVGYQIGVQSTDVILVFKTPKSIDRIAKGTFTLGADASIAAGPVGRSTSASTNVVLKAEIYSYSRSRGLFAGVALEGASLEIDYGSNRLFYRQPALTVDDLLANRGVESPPVGQEFLSVLAKYAP